VARLEAGALGLAAEVPYGVMSAACEIRREKAADAGSTKVGVRTEGQAEGACWRTDDRWSHLDQFAPSGLWTALFDDEGSYEQYAGPRSAALALRDRDLKSQSGQYAKTVDVLRVGESHGVRVRSGEDQMADAGHPKE